MAHVLMAATIEAVKEISIKEINELDANEFIDLLGEIYEHSSWVAEKTFQQKPFNDLDFLHKVMSQIVKESGQDRQRELIRSHPELAGKAVLTTYSNNEQQSAGLASCNAEQIHKINEFSKKYLDKFNFPFVMVVKGRDVDTILSAFSQRLENSQEDEFERALAEIDKIARFRLEELING